MKDVKVTFSEVIALLEEGKTRKEIADHFGISLTVLREKIFSHPDLKNRRARKRPSDNIILVDDRPQTDGTSSTDSQLPAKTGEVETVSEPTKTFPVAEVETRLEEVETETAATEVKKDQEKVETPSEEKSYNPFA